MINVCDIFRCVDCPYEAPDCYDTDEWRINHGGEDDYDARWDGELE